MISINKKYIMIFITTFTLLFTIMWGFIFFKKDDDITSDKINATILKKTDKKVTVQDENSIIYTFNIIDMNAEVGDHIAIEYTGIIDRNKEKQKVSLINYKTISVSYDDDGLPSVWNDDGIFKQFYILANNKLQSMSLEEKIGQLLLARYPDTDVEAINVVEDYKIGGYVFFEKDFKDKRKQEVQEMITNVQNVSDIPLLTAVDEEGGKVVRVSSNSNLVNESFKSSKELYNEGGFDLIRDDTLRKSEVLRELGLNLNLAPVVDVSINPDSYINDRTLGESTELTSTYAKTVIEASKENNVSYTLKHFPGYGDNSDTHTSSSIDDRTFEEIESNDLPPFQAGIDAGAEAVLVSHNTVTSVDSANPASLSPSVHNLLRNKLKFTGVIISDDIAMGATSSISNVTTKALLAGNDIVITTDYKQSINDIKDSLENGTIDEALIDRLAFRVLAWKYYKGLMFEHK